MRRLTARLAALTSSLALASTLAVTVAAPAHAEPPVVGDDQITMHANTIAMPDLLANDSDADGDELKVCRIEEQLDPPVGFFEFLGIHLVVADVDVEGTFEFTYWACDFETLVPGTLTVHVKPSPKAAITVKKAKKPGTVRVSNKSNFPLDFAWGSAASEDPDGQVKIGKKKTRVVTVRRTAITWMAQNAGNGAHKVGYLRGIKLPKKGKKLPPSPRPRSGEAFAFTGALSALSDAEQGWLSPLRAVVAQRSS